MTAVPVDTSGWAWFARYHGNHAVVLLPGAAAAKEGDQEDDHAHSDQDDGAAGRGGVVDGEGLVQGHLDHDADDDQRQATQLEKRGQRSNLFLPLPERSSRTEPILIFLLRTKTFD